jgi:hypothetical protein
MTKKIGAKIGAFVGLSLLFGVGSGAVASAQTAMVQTTPSVGPCLVLPINLRLGATDYGVGGYVSQLQSFLVNEGYFNSIYLGSGRFGPITLQAVVRFQADHGLPATGFVGPMTRAYLTSRNCGIVPPKETLSISSANPASGPIGTDVYVNGTGLTNSNTILMDGSVVAQNVPASTIAVSCLAYDPSCQAGIRQTVHFTVPEYLSPRCAPGMYCLMMVRQMTPGPHVITVENQNGTSNSITFTVTDNGANQGTLSIQGVNAPSTISMSVPGTWSLSVAAPSTSGTLHYSVTWGDENFYVNSSIMAPQPTTNNLSATFTHTYQRAGTYTPVFRVTDDYGHTATASASVVVTPIY